jgi:MraZ protein
MASSPPQFRIFAGTVRHALDEKNRVTIPSRWRDEEIDEFYAIADPRKAVVLLVSAEELGSMTSDIDALEDISVSQKRAFTRQLFASARPCPIGKQGRIVLPPDLCEQLGFTGEVVMAGTGTRIEVAAPEVWEAMCEQEKEAFIQGAHHLGL